MARERVRNPERELEAQHGRRKKSKCTHVVTPDMLAWAHNWIEEKGSKEKTTLDDFHVECHDYHGYVFNPENPIVSEEEAKNWLHTAYECMTIV